MTHLDRSRVYIFLLRSAAGERVGVREWTGREWKTRRLRRYVLSGPGPWRVMRAEFPFWPRGPRMVLEVQA
jgi:hypothetical protein